MKRSLVIAAVGLALGAPRALGGVGPGEVTAVSVLPGPGSVNVVIDVRGSVTVQDFTLKNPYRLVIDVTGATLRAPGIFYDGVNRGGILNIRYRQFRPDVVRIVLELESLKDYKLVHADDAVRVELGTDRGFTAWSSVAPASLPVARRERGAGSGEPAARGQPGVPVQPLPQLQAAQQPVISVTFDSAAISDVTATFASFSGKSILLGAGIVGRVNANITNQPWDVAFQAILESQGLAAVEEPPGIIKVQSQAALAARDSLEPLRTALIPINYARASSMASSVAGILSKRGKVVPDTSTNSLILTDVVSRIEEDSQFVARLDVATPQVVIQAKLIFVDRSEIEDLGIRYDLGTSRQFFNTLVTRPDPRTAEPVDTDGDGIPDLLQATENFAAGDVIVDLGGSALSAIANAQAAVATPALRLIFATALGNFNLTSFVEALQQVDLADLQAEPIISTADNQTASILVGERTPIRIVDVGAPGQVTAARATTSLQETGIKLEVTPHVTNNNQV
ncbi:MAG: AMIN domain-containing protein, partial [Gemmatimonadetes bacterium]|nr:AMIN domain-containing protein [Gemmatimonadota bacterium]